MVKCQLCSCIFSILATQRRVVQDDRKYSYIGIKDWGGLVCLVTGSWLLLLSWYRIVHRVQAAHYYNITPYQKYWLVSQRTKVPFAYQLFPLLKTGIIFTILLPNTHCRQIGNLIWIHVGSGMSQMNWCL